MTGRRRLLALLSLAAWPRPSPAAPSSPGNVPFGAPVMAPGSVGGIAGGSAIPAMVPGLTYIVTIGGGGVTRPPVRGWYLEASPDETAR
jgi:hypothetical protein